jgi:hypothetical protein
LPDGEQGGDSQFRDQTNQHREAQDYPRSTLSQPQPTGQKDCRTYPSEAGYPTKSQANLIRAGQVTEHEGNHSTVVKVARADSEDRGLTDDQGTGRGEAGGAAQPGCVSGSDERWDRPVGPGKPETLVSSDLAMGYNPEHG